MTDQKKKGLKTFLTRYRIFTLVIFILVSLWAYYNYTHEHRSFTLFIMVFFFVSIFLPKPSFTLVLVTVISYLLFSSVSIPALNQIRHTSVEAVAHPSIPLNNLLTPDTGLEVLPEEALQALSMIDTNKVEEYRLSPSLNEDYHTMQRIVESAWPVRMREDARHVFIRAEEIADFQKCQLIEEKDLIALVYCD